MPGPQPHRRRHEHDRRGPRDRIEHGADFGGVGCGLEQIGGVPEHVQRDPDGHKKPWCLAPARQQCRAADDQQQQQDVTDRVGEVDRRRQAALAGGVLDRAERECRTYGRGSQAGDGAVEPRRGAQPARLAAEEQRQRYVREREEADVEGVRDRRHRGSGPSERLDRQREIAETPRQQGGAEDQRYGTIGAPPHGAGDAHGAGGQLEGVNAPSVDQGRVALTAAKDRVREVGHEQHSHDGVRDEHRRASAAWRTRKRARSSCRRRGSRYKHVPTIVGTLRPSLKGSSAPAGRNTDIRGPGASHKRPPGATAPPT